MHVVLAVLWVGLHVQTHACQMNWEVCVCGGGGGVLSFAVDVIGLGPSALGTDR